jgi:hypothetical protein
METSNWIALFSLFVSVGAIGMAWKSNYLAGKANNLNVQMFKRQGVIDLHMAWQGINDIDAKNLITPDIVKAVNALSLTASLWNHDVIEKSILYQSYWRPYKQLFEKLNSIDELVPGKKETCKSLMTNEIVKAYEEMKNTDLDTVISTKII